GKVALCRDGVVVAGEDEQRNVRPPLACPEERVVALEHGREGRRDESAKVLPDLRLLEALRCDVHELERSSGKSVGERAHGRRAYRGRERGILPAMPVAHPER